MVCCPCRSQEGGCRLFMLILDHKLSHREIEYMLLQEYDFQPYKIEPIGNVKKISCAQGTFAFKRSTASLEQLEQLQEWHKYLKEKDFKHLLPFYPNKFGDSFIRIGDFTYYVTPWIKEQTEHKYKNRWEIEMLAALGGLHQLTYDAKLFVERDKAGYLSLQRILERWRLRLQQLQDMQSLARSRTLMSTIEGSFLNHYKYLESLAEKAIVYLEKWQSCFDESEQRLVLSLGNLHRQHVLHDQQSYYFINLDYARLDFPARDLALFYRRHLDKTLEWNEEEGLAWLQNYEASFPLRREEKLLLSIFLLFPESAIKEMDMYYQGKRDWHPTKHTRFFERKVRLTYVLRKMIRTILDEEEIIDGITRSD